MRAIIELDEDNLASIQFFNGEEIASWSDYTQEQKEEFVNTLRSFYSLFSKCL